MAPGRLLRGVKLAGTGLLTWALLACSWFGLKDKKDEAAAERSKTVAPSPVPSPVVVPPPAASTPEPRKSALSYDFEHPERRWVLPKKLKEISGLVAFSDHEIACIQDESGSVFFYDLRQDRITKTRRFAGRGDYEELTDTGQKFYVLRSDGRLFELDQTSPSESRERKPHLPKGEYESMVWDQRTQRLVFVPKKLEHPYQDDRRAHPIFAWDPETPKAPAVPLGVVHSQGIAERAAEVARRQGKKVGKHFARRFRHFEASALAVDPITGQLLILSSVEHRIIATRRDGEVLDERKLDPDLFPQPEGLAVLANGDLLISNEAAGLEPTVLLFRRH